jgi:fucose permease
LTQPLHVSATADDASTPIGWKELPYRFWLYAASVFLYGMIETLNGNWSMLYLSSERGVSPRDASLALTSFWIMVTLGRVLIAASSRWIPARWIYVALPIILFVTFQIAARVQDSTGGIVAFGLAGLACSAFLPLSISFGGNEFPRLSAVMAGELIAFYQLGYGVAAFGIGPLHDRIGLAFATIFAMGSIVAVPLAVIAGFVIRRAVARG